MYLGIVSVVTRRKESKCSLGGCNDSIEAGKLALTVVRKGKKFRRYLAFHLGCFQSWFEFMYERRVRYREEHPVARSGRPVGSPVKDLMESSPELAAERHRCVRARARLLRCILHCTDPDKVDKWQAQVDALSIRIIEILPMQVALPGHRSRNDAELLTKKASESHLRAIQNSKTTAIEEPRPTRRQVDTSDPTYKTTEEWAELFAQQAEDRERLSRSAGQVVVEDGIGQEDGGIPIREWQEDGEV
jgi:hypothetical protein